MRCIKKISKISAAIILNIFFLSCSLLSADYTEKNSDRAVATVPDNRVSVFPDPGLMNPKIHFHTGQVEANKPALYPELPNIPGIAASPWFFTQWRRPKALSPLIMAPDPGNDSVLGKALYYFPSEDEKTHLKIYRSKKGDYVYELFSRDGILSGVGGTNVFLSVDATEPVTLEKKIDFEVDLKFSSAAISYKSAAAKSSGAVMSQLFSGFILNYQDPLNPTVMPTSLFMQIYHNNTSYPNQKYLGCYRHGTSMEIVFGNVLAADPKLDFVASSEAPKKMNFVMNKYLCELVRSTFNCDDNGKKYSFSFPPAAKNFENWKISSMYIGLETQNTDLRPQSQNREAQGAVTAGVQISNLKMMKDAAQNFDYNRDCSR